MDQPTNYVTRSDLGWPSTSGGNSATPRSGLVVHYDSSDQNLANKPHADCLTYWRNTRSFHMGPQRGWADVGYSWLSCSHGYVIEGRGLGREQAAQPGGNRTHYSVTLATGPNDAITDDQINAVRELRRWLMDDHGNAGTVLGHRDFTATSCPGDRAYRMVQDGTFTGAPGAITSEGDEEMLGLSRGDKGARVESLQTSLRHAGFADLLGPYGPREDGVDGDYGQGTEDAVLAARQYVGSGASSGASVSGPAAAQIRRAVVKRDIERALDGLDLTEGAC
ncbi:peptidoglycan recognition protein family protein [Nocardiopsis salina]|uniref:peptidoglycan recognition protein family protein n=1 Tax=Nocardiopsis salina TaxID=245836 RepID=UPI00034513D9|nr:peptidoglycan recognition family protein [Nocardiopsis salina]